jgi:alanine racemase
VIFQIANSFATIYNKKYQFDMVRSGFLMYGDMQNEIGTKCILTIKSKLINVFEIKKGDNVGYDRTFVASNKMTIGVVPVGYADGFDRKLSNNFSVLIISNFVYYRHSELLKLCASCLFVPF